ncbi:MAG: hypothetical protein GY754_43360 [bacterium]|nr:hypothetical protein [bacterium]
MIIKNNIKSNLCLLIIPFIAVSLSCSKDKKKNMVDLEQIDIIDGSNNNRYLFRKEIEKEKWRKNRYKKDEF